MEATSMHTDRLELRPVRDDDVERILEYRNLPEVSRWLLRTEVDPTSFRAAWRRAAEDADDHSVAVVLDGVVIGTVSLDVVDGMGQPGMPTRTEAELGYIFDPAYAGRGYATEAVTAMVAHAFDRLGVRRITAGCFADNLASVRLLEKIGMRREQHGVRDSWHAELGWVDGYTYGLLVETWRARAAQRDGETPSLEPAMGVGSKASPMTETSAPRQLRLIIETDDFDGAVAFYRDVLGMPEQPAFATAGDDRVSILHAGTATIELATAEHTKHIDQVEGAPHEPGPTLRIALEVDDTPAALDSARDHGLRVIAPPIVTPFQTINGRISGPAGWQVTFFQELESLDQRSRREGFTTDDRRAR